jgi:suppressor for copper-sensitivity B
MRFRGRAIADRTTFQVVPLRPIRRRTSQGVLPHLTVWLASFLGLWLADWPAWAQLASDPPIHVSARFTHGYGGKPAGLFITAKLQPGWHIYSITQPPRGPNKTEIKLAKTNAWRQLGDLRPQPPPEVGTDEAFPGVPIETHTGTVVWYAPIELAPGVDPGSVKIDGRLNAQLCDAGTCTLQDIPFTAHLGSGREVPAAAAAAAPSFDEEILQEYIAKQDEGTSLWLQLAAGFVGGILLNLMPCVLPVIGLKILSFVEQAGHDRKTALSLNVWYSLGLLSVFWVLAGLTIALKLTIDLTLQWGGLFQYATFNVFIAALVFTMAIAFLGVWEFPVPGFVGRGRAMELAGREGMAGAFFKGVITTILATPCTGPYMGTALAWAAAQPPHTVAAVFTSVGLGMASPYLLIGAFPRLIRFLPKPGPWMETFKQLMGFVLLGTVVFVFTFLQTSYIVPTIGLLFVLWLACWWVGRTPATAEPQAKARAWLEAAALVGLGWLLLFPGFDRVVPDRLSGWGRGLHAVMEERLEERIALAAGDAKPLKRSPYDLPWQPFTTKQALVELLNSGKTVLVDFTADWCATCKTLEALYLNTREVRDLVQRNGVVTVKADCTDTKSEASEMLKLLGAAGVPVVAIFPAGRPTEPVRFIGGYTQGKVLDALEKAGPSRAVPSTPEAARSGSP